MALDTRQKRQSAVGVARPWMRSHDTGTIDAAWRQSAGNIYAGNTVGTGDAFDEELLMIYGSLMTGGFGAPTGGMQT